MGQFDRNVKSIATLDDDLRRSMFQFARRRPAGVNREQVAKEFGVSRKLAGFHLDRLADLGLLAFHYARPPGRSGPGAGRPAKVYRASESEIEVSVPARKYDLVGSLLVDTLRSSPDGGAARARSIAYGAGLDAGRRAREQRSAKGSMASTTELIEDYGYEPDTAGGEVSLKNCPFHALARQAPELVCTMNHGFLEGLVRGLGNDEIRVDLVPTPGQCCVRLRQNDQPVEGPPLRPLSAGSQP